MQKKRALVKLSEATINRAAYVEKLSTEEYKEHARKRNGVEGVPSILRRRYGVDRMPVRGLLRSKLWFGFKIGAINVKRVIAATQNPADSLILCDMSAESAAGASPRPTIAYIFLDYFCFPSKPCPVTNENILCVGYAA